MKVVPYSIAQRSKRRLLLKFGLLVSMSASLLPRLAFALWPKIAFEKKQVSEALRELVGNDRLTESADISLTIPDLAENGAVVPVTVASTLPGIESIFLLVDKNPSALVASFDLAENTQAYMKVNIKMAETAQVIAVLKSGDTLYSASKKVKVVLNGCSS